LLSLCTGNGWPPFDRVKMFSATWSRTEAVGWGRGAVAGTVSSGGTHAGLTGAAASAAPASGPAMLAAASSRTVFSVVRRRAMMP